MERRLQDFIKSVETISDIRNRAITNPIILSLEHPDFPAGHEIGEVPQHYKVIASQIEPVIQHIDLPINVIWICYDHNSKHYKTAFKRLNAAASGGFNSTWKVLDSYSEIFEHPQYYINIASVGEQGPKGDKGDRGEVGPIGLTGATGSDATLPFASEVVYGKVRLNIPALNAAEPIVVGANDPRLTDARTPKAHTHTLPFDMAFGISGEFKQSDVVGTLVGLHLATRSILIPKTFNESLAKHLGDANGTTNAFCEFLLQRNNVTIATIRFTNTSSNGMFAASSNVDIEINKGDVLMIRAPAEVNTFCRDVAITIVGYAAASDYSAAPAA